MTWVRSLKRPLTESPSIKDLRMRTEEINSVIELLQELFESKFGGKDAPVVSTSVEGGSVVFRIFAVNPFEGQTAEGADQELSS